MTEETNNENTSSLQLSDEEFAKLDFDFTDEESGGSKDSSEDEEDSKKEDDTESDDTSTDDFGSEEEDSSEDESSGTDGEDDEESDDDEDEVGTETKLEEDSKKSTEESKKVTINKSKSKSTSTKDSDNTTDTGSVDYKEVYEKIFSPFKANGKEIKAKDVDDVVQLMKMGAGFHKKMANLKPNLRFIKMLENNDLLSEDKLSYLIDLSKKNPKAINKLVKDSGIDPETIDTEEEVNYKPSTYTVNDKAIELDGILEDIKETKSFNQTLNIIGNKWDSQSKEIIQNNPSIIKIINEHVEQGLYDQIQQAVDSERMFGRLNGLSDIEAYKQVGDQINANGGFSKPENSTSSTLGNNTAKKVKKQVDPKLKERKRAAGSTKSIASKTESSPPNPLSMSDEEFKKIAGNY